MNCLICGSADASIRQKMEGYRQGDFYDIRECNSCGVSWADPLRSDPKIYDQIYKNVARVPGYARYYALAKAIESKKNALRYIMQADDCYFAVGSALLREEPRVKRVVEIGCGQGYLTHSLVQHGFDAVGIDISYEAVSLATKRFGAHYYTGTLADYLKAGHEPPSHVVCTELIEHLENPVRFVTELMEDLPSGGKLVLTTPNKVDGKGVWDTELPPVHLWWFTRASLLRMGDAAKAKTTFIDFSEFYRAHGVREHAESGKARRPIMDADYRLIQEARRGAFDSLKSMAKSILPDNMATSIKNMRQENSGPILDDSRSRLLCAIYER